MTLHQRAARAAFLLTLGSALVCALGVVAVRMGAAAPLSGFAVNAVAMVTGGGLGLLLSVLAVWLARREEPGTVMTRRLVAAALLAVLLLAPVVLMITQAGDHPPINDITTDLVDPPPLGPGGVASAAPLPYPEAFVDQVRSAHPDLDGLVLALSPPEALSRAREVAATLGWETLGFDEASGLLEARQTSAVFRFVDDITVRVRAEEGGSRIDVRSRSRDGRSDLGVNARRIREFLEALAAT